MEESKEESKKKGKSSMIFTVIGFLLCSVGLVFTVRYVDKLKLTQEKKPINSYEHAGLTGMAIILGIGILASSWVMFSYVDNLHRSGIVYKNFIAMLIVGVGIALIVVCKENRKDLGDDIQQTRFNVGIGVLGVLEFVLLTFLGINIAENS